MKNYCIIKRGKNPYDMTAWRRVRMPRVVAAVLRAFGVVCIAF